MKSIKVIEFVGKLQISSLSKTEFNPNTTMMARAIYGKGPEDNTYATATPSGTMMLELNNPSIVDALKQGDELRLHVEVIRHVDEGE